MGLLLKPTASQRQLHSPVTPVSGTEVGKQYHAINFGSVIAGTDNVIVVHEPHWPSLGLCHAFDDKKGWEMFDVQNLILKSKHANPFKRNGQISND